MVARAERCAGRAAGCACVECRRRSARAARAERRQRTAAEAALRLGDDARVQRALHKFLGVVAHDEPRGSGARYRLVLFDVAGGEAFELAYGGNVAAKHGLAKAILISFLHEVLSW